MRFYWSYHTISVCLSFLRLTCYWLPSCAWWWPHNYLLSSFFHRFSHCFWGACSTRAEWQAVHTIWWWVQAYSIASGCPLSAASSHQPLSSCIHWLILALFSIRSVSFPKIYLSLLIFPAVGTSTPCWVLTAYECGLSLPLFLRLCFFHSLRSSAWQSIDPWIFVSIGSQVYLIFWHAISFFPHFPQGLCWVVIFRWRGRRLSGCLLNFPSCCWWILVLVFSFLRSISLFLSVAYLSFLSISISPAIVKLFWFRIRFLFSWFRQFPIWSGCGCCWDCWCKGSSP